MAFRGRQCRVTHLFLSKQKADSLALFVCVILYAYDADAQTSSHKQQESISWSVAAGLAINLVIGVSGLVWNYRNRKYMLEIDQKNRRNSQKLADFEIARGRLVKCLDDLSRCASEIRIKSKQSRSVDDLKNELKVIQDENLSECFCRGQTVVDAIDCDKYNIDRDIFDNIEDDINGKLNIIYDCGCTMPNANKAADEIHDMICCFIKNLEENLSHEAGRIIES